MEITEKYLIEKGFEAESKFEFSKKIISYKQDYIFQETLDKSLEIYVNFEDNSISVSLDSVTYQDGDLDCISIKLSHIQTQKQLEDLYLILSNKSL